MINQSALRDKIIQKEKHLYAQKLAHTNNTKKSNEGQFVLSQQNKEQSHQNLSEQDIPIGDLEQNTLSTLDTNEVEFYQQPKIVKNRSKYGNMLIFFQTENFVFGLGPNYLFFFFAYLCFTLATIYLVGLVNQSVQSKSFKIFNFIFCWMQNISYLLVALSNPGIKLPSDKSLMSEKNLKNKRFCNKCNAVQERTTYHCRQCDICIVDYDHHCPWTSKCIGGGNLYRFYFFVCMTPVYIFYYMVAFMICMANTAFEHSSNLKVQTKLI